MAEAFVKTFKRESAGDSLWRAFVCNKSGTYSVPAGYCSTRCTDDTDCGDSGVCVSFGTTGKFCFGGCANAWWRRPRGATSSESPLPVAMRSRRQTSFSHWQSSVFQ